MSSDNPAYGLALISQFLWIPFYIWACGFVLTRSDERRRAKSMTLIALFLMIVCHAGSLAVRWLLVSYVSSDAMVTASLLTAAITGIVSMLAHGLLIVAVFTGRTPEKVPAPPGSGTAITDDTNPYHVPSV